MPTGYTAGVADGTVTEFKEYAMSCARAFGACISMRDDPHDAEIPEKFEPSSYHADAIERAESDLKILLDATQAELNAAAKLKYTVDLNHNQNAIAERQKQRERYEEMLAKAKAYEPPSDDHADFAEFMVSQLTQSIEFDCSTSYYEENMPKQLTAAEFRLKEMNRLEDSIEYHKREYVKEVQRTEKRNKWIQLLRESLSDA